MSKVTHRATNTEWAVKSISKSRLAAKSDIADVQREVAVMNHVLGHPNIISLRVRTVSRFVVELLLAYGVNQS